MGTGRPEDQQLPVANGHPFVQDLMQDELDRELAEENLDPGLGRIYEALKNSIEARRALGEKRYGIPGLQPFNGRDMLRDAFEEVLDSAVYLKALVEEGEIGGLEDTYAAIMLEALELQACILEREDDAASQAPAESESPAV